MKIRCCLLRLDGSVEKTKKSFAKICTTPENVVSLTGDFIRRASKNKNLKNSSTRKTCISQTQGRRSGSLNLPL
ncbi:hypothetical protein HanRHA438_Chr08g0350301 [Helianthus annuus]|nr:hypothetical protein HanRHA438_Chr08g0350301 [Helianthus annuus]